MEPDFIYQDKAIYFDGELMGEFSDGRFVPSRLLLEKNTEFQDDVEAFSQEVLENMRRKKAREQKQNG